MHLPQTAKFPKKFRSLLKALSSIEKRTSYKAKQVSIVDFPISIVINVFNGRHNGIQLYKYFKPQII